LLLVAILQAVQIDIGLVAQFFTTPTLPINMLHHMRAQFQLRVACLIFLHTPTTLEASLVQVVGPASAQTAARSLRYARQPIFLQAFLLGFHFCSMNPTHAWSAARVRRATSLLISTYQPNSVHHTNSNLYISQPGVPLSLWFVPACLTKE